MAGSAGAGVVAMVVTGSGAAVGRAQGFRETLNANITILDTQTGNFNPTEAKPIAESFLKKYAGQIDGFFIHNDGMAQAVVEAMKIKKESVLIILLL